MYICNLKLDVKKILIICLIIALAVTLIIELTNMSGKSANTSYDYVLNEQNFTEILKAVHNDITGNIGKTVKLSGYIFTLPDFKETNFVCGRDMMLDGDEKVVGFLCECEKAKDFAEGEWVEITGTFEKGYYMTDMPVIKATTIKKITAPANTFVEAPASLTN